jgi:hypothetical protein
MYNIQPTPEQFRTNNWENNKIKRKMSKTNIKELEDSVIMQKLLTELRHTPFSLSKELEYKSHSSIDHIVKGRNMISGNMIDSIIKKYPNINYWFLKKGKMPIVLDNSKLAHSQANIFNSGESNKKSEDYGLETLAALKSIDRGIYQQIELTKELIELLKKKKADQL